MKRNEAGAGSQSVDRLPHLACSVAERVPCSSYLDWD